MSHSSELAPSEAATPDAPREWLIQEQDSAGSPICRIPRISGSTQLSLSFAQERLWLLDQLVPGSSSYVQPLALRLTGPLNPVVLGECLSEIVRRHEVLRTTFPAEEGRPVPIVAPAQPVAVPRLDLSDLTGSERAARLLQLAQQEARQPFDLARGPLLRATLLRLSRDEHVLLLTAHAIIFDRWSVPALIQEFAALHTAISAARTPSLPEPVIQYHDFAAWQRQCLQGEVLNDLLSFWKQQLTAAPAALELPTACSRAAASAGRGRSYSLLLPPSLSQALAELCHGENTPLFAISLAAFQVLLHRYTGQDDLVIGTPVSGRGGLESEGLIGPYANVLLLRADMGGDPTFRELLQRVREVTDRASEHQDMPVEKLVKELGSTRDPAQRPVAQVLFQLQTFSRDVLKAGDLEIAEIELAGRSVEFDLNLEITSTTAGVSCSFEYNTSRFDEATIVRMAAHFQTLLQGIVSDPEQHLSSLPLLTEAERHQLLVEWNDTHSPFPHQACLHELFEAQVERTPEALAVLAEGQQLSYGQLNRLANQLAHHLRTLGVGPDVPVGIYVERSPEMLIGILGILKAGGAYVPLEPSYPAERLAFMLQDSQVTVLVTQERLLPNLPEHDAKIVCLDTAEGLIACESEANPVRRTSPANLACLLYTSGSTGQPKGTLLQHRSLVNYTTAAAARYALAPGDRVLQFAPISFDASAEEIFPTLSSGAALVLRTDAMLTTPASFLQWCQEWAISVLDLPTAYWHTITLGLDNGTAPLPPSLRLVIIGGEKALPERAAAWQKYAGHQVQLVNTYGPTEATIVASWCDLVGGESAEFIEREVPIGRPVPNVQIYLLDRYLQLVPIGVIGEIYIGGVGLAAGYLRRPDQTAEKFVDHPFSREPGLRLYRTGDLARYRSGGCLEFVGRLDDQVKVNGFRIELGEIEAALATHPAVLQNQVLVRENAPGEKHLVAYIVSDREQPPSSFELRQFLREKLPGHMVPSSYLILDALPLTPNGKVDRALLSSLGQSSLRPETSFVPPRDELELRLVKIWKETLEISPIGVRDNFFEIGGTSLQAVRLFTAIEAIWGQQLPLATLFQAPTVEDMAAILRQDGWSHCWPSLVTIQPKGSKLPLFCIHPITGHVLCYRVLAAYLGTDQPVYGIQAQAARPNEQIRFEQLAAQYIKEIRALQPQGPYFLAGYSFGGVVAFEIAQQLYAQGERVALLAVLDSDAPVDPEPWELMKMNLLPCTRTLRKLPAGEKLTYLATGLQQLIIQQAVKGARRLKHLLFPGVGLSWRKPARTVEWLLIDALMRYKPRIYPHRLTLFRAREQPSNQEDCYLGWGPLTASGIHVIEVPGRHGTILKEPNVQVLAKHLASCIAEAQEEEHVRAE
jgi:amino acid adenylation domain-containing protein